MPTNTDLITFSGINNPKKHQYQTKKEPVSH